MVRLRKGARPGGGGDVRSDGTKVKGYPRWAAGGRREPSIVVVVCLAVAVLGNPSSADGAGDSPRPTPGGVYPVKFPTEKKPSRPRPEPTVSFPINFPETRKAPVRPASQPTVTYPIPWDGSGR